ncbi:MAG: OmpA family protein [Deltaproteobacteria bacterium]|nr:OmpA family protein [Deltaproteobacteria bacterium]
MLRSCFLSLLVTTLVVGCATPPKPRELDALEELRADPGLSAARKRAPDLCKKADKALAAATDKWQSNDLGESVNHALLGQIFYRHALALADQDKSNARIAEAEDALAVIEEEQKAVQKDLDDEKEKIGLLNKAAQQSEEMKSLAAQMAADKKANEEKLAQEKLRADTGDRIADAELALKTADTVDAEKYAPELYKSASQILAKAQAEFQAGQMEQAQASAGIAKKTAQDAAAAAKPSYERDAAAEAIRKKADAFHADALRLPGVNVRRDIKGSLQRVVISVPATLLFIKRQTVIGAGKDMVLNPIGELLKKPEYASFPVQVIGHTDSRGRASSNLALSAARAQTVYNALVTRGVEARRMMTNGQGGADPIADGRTAAGRAANHRVEIVVLYQ